MEEDILYRVVSIRPSPTGGKDIHHVKDWFTREAALRYAQWVSDGRGKVVSVCKFVLAEKLQ